MARRRPVALHQLAKLLCLSDNTLRPKRIIGKAIPTLNDIQKRNRNKLVEYFASGATSAQKLGFELEHILLHAKTGKPISYSEPCGVRDILDALAPAYRTKHFEGNNIVGLQKSYETISIEPAGQLEISTGPFRSVSEIETAYLDFRSALDSILEKFDLTTPMLGYNPSACAKDLELVPKKRYESMSAFLGKQAYSSICMMRGSASLQISVDYTDEADAMRKLRVAEALSPVLALMSDNSPVYEGARIETHLARTAMWAGMNQDRVGTVPGSLDLSFGFEDYADYILSREAILVPGTDEGEEWRYVGDQTFDEIYANREMTEAELEHALSMVWPDARLKNFIEIRPADAMPLKYSLAYTALVRALFYNQHNLEALEEMLNEVSEADIRSAKQNLIKEGYSAKVYGQPATFWTDTILALAADAMEAEDLDYLAPLANLVQSRTTLANV